MKNEVLHSEENTLGRTAILVHLGLVILGTAALLSGLAAGDYKKFDHMGFTLHSWIGLAGSYIILLRVALGLVGPPELRFANWVPFTREKLSYVKVDIIGLCRLHLPDRPTHVGVSGLVHASGLLVFLLLALSGIFLFFTIDPGHKSRGMVHAVKEFHEVGLSLMLVFLSLHMGAVIMHALRGHDLWRKMFLVKEARIDPT